METHELTEETGFVCQINNAGTGGGSSSLDEWHRTINVNLYGVLNGVETFKQAMLDQGER